MQYTIVLLFLSCVYPTSAQFTEGQRRYLNKQITYINESVHGLLISHRLFEGYNQEINKFLDLPSYKINDFGNKDLPENIFGGNNQLFYEKPPDQLYKELLVDNRRKDFPLDTWPLISQLRSLTKFVNNERLSLGKALENQRLNQLTTIQKVFLGLENAASYYLEYNENINSLESALLPHYHNQKALDPAQNQVYTALVEIHFDIKAAIRLVRSEDRSAVDQVFTKIQKECNWLKTCIAKLNQESERKTLDHIYSLLVNTRDVISEYSSGIQPPDEYSMYGPGYYVYNVKLLTLINRYGNGYVSEVNSFFNDSAWPVIHLLEEAHFVKVIYPEKVPKEAVSKSPQPKKPVVVVEKNLEEAIAESPREKLNVVVEKPKVAPFTIISSHSILVDSTVFDIELYDHRIKDGDLVSINVNGDWLFQHVSLEKEARQLRLTIDPTIENFILIKAENEGWRPPSTIGIKYLGKRSQDNFYLIQDLLTSQAIEIKYRLR